MRLDRLPIAMLTEMSTLRGETVTLAASLTKRSSWDQSDSRDGPQLETFTGDALARTAGRAARRAIRAYRGAASRDHIMVDGCARCSVHNHPPSSKA